MGAWGYKNFENDTAMDWFTEFIADPDVEDIKDVFEYILEEDEFLDSEESAVALACAEIIVNRLEPTNKENIPDGYDLDNLKLKISKKLVQSAISSVDKIVNFKEDSELRELWEESDEYENWLAEQNRLLENLSKYK